MNPRTLLEVDSPALLVDIDRMRRNIQKMARFAKECGVELRPHVKTHKVPAIARMQLEAGSKGICVQKVSEAEVFAGAGFENVFITNEVVGRQKLVKLVELAERNRISVAVDNEANVHEISNQAKEAGAEIALFVDVDVGMHRCGVRPESAPALANLISRSEGVSLGGIMGYEGHVGGAKNDVERDRLCRASTDSIARAKREMVRSGISVESVSMGSSVSVWTNAKNPDVTEVQPGMYVFNDGFLMSNKVASPEECALTVLTTVMSTPAPDRAVVDAGSKAFQFDMGHYPSPLERKGLEMIKFSEEHGWLKVSAGAKTPALGERVRFIPYHCCTCVNQHDWMFGFRGEKVETVCRVEARGKMS